jgi:signal transduction histidine kinase
MTQFKKPTMRLAATYLAIIMALSVGFSVIFYNTSTGSLGNSAIRLQSSQDDDKPKSTPSGATGTISLENGSSPKVIKSPDELTQQLQQSISIIKHDLVNQLVMLNVGALLVGAIFSYVLARYTLRPMEEALDMQARFSSDASHELRTPLTALKTRGEVALRKQKLTLAEAKAVIQSSVDQAAKLEKLSEGLLRLGASNPKKLVRSPLTVADLTTEATNSVIEPAQAKDIAVDDTGVDDCRVLGDEDSLVQIIAILLDNAVKYSDRGGTIYIETDSDQKYGYIKVRDEGGGMRATDLPYIFERFYRADYARTKHGKHGYGLGLSIAKKLVEQNGGTITVESTLGKGSTFTVKLLLSQP